MISTRDLSGLPDIERLIRLHQSLAVLDAILCPEWEFRYFSFNAEWEENGHQLGVMRNGEGDDWLLFCTPAGALLKGYVHNSAMAENAPWPGLYDQVPVPFAGFLGDPAYTANLTSFCIWRLTEDSGWHTSDVERPAGDDPDGSGYLLSFLDGEPTTYKRWADEYYGKAVHAGAVDRVYRHQPLNRGLVSALNPEVDFDELCDEVTSGIHYPVA